MRFPSSYTDPENTSGPLTGPLAFTFVEVLKPRWELYPIERTQGTEAIRPFRQSAASPVRGATECVPFIYLGRGQRRKKRGFSIGILA